MTQQAQRAAANAFNREGLQTLKRLESELAAARSTFSACCEHFGSDVGGKEVSSCLGRCTLRFHAFVCYLQLSVCAAQAESKEPAAFFMIMRDFAKDVETAAAASAQREAEARAKARAITGKEKMQVGSPGPDHQASTAVLRL